MGKEAGKQDTGNDTEMLYAEIGRLQLQREHLAKAFEQTGIKQQECYKKIEEIERRSNG